MAKNSTYDKAKADLAVGFIEHLCHTKGTWNGQPFTLLPWQEQIIRDLFGIVKPNGYRQFNTAYVEIPKKNGKSELAAAIALLLTCGDFEERAEVYGCAAVSQQSSQLSQTRLLPRKSLTFTKRHLQQTTTTDCNSNQNTKAASCMDLPLSFL